MAPAKPVVPVLPLTAAEIAAYDPAALAVGQWIFQTDNAPQRKSGYYRWNGATLEADLPPEQLVRSRLSGTLAPPTLAVVNNDYNPAGFIGSTVILLSASPPAAAITGLQAGRDGDLIVLVNISATPIGLLANNVLSQPANRFKFSRDSLLLQDDTLAIVYDGATQSWRPLVSFGDDLFSFYFGAGADGNVNIPSGTVTLTKDLLCNNLTLSGSGAINTNGFRIFVRNILDMRFAGPGAIFWNGTPGTNATNATGAAAPPNTGQQAGSVFPGLGPAAGANGTTTNGAQAGSVSAMAVANGGGCGASGKGGNGSAGTGGAARAAISPVVAFPVRRFAHEMLRGFNSLGTGQGGQGGGGGGGDNTNSGGGGGSGGWPGHTVYISANIVLRSVVTAAGAIQAKGAKGGNGANAAAGNAGGGGAGSGGGGGWIWIAYRYLIGDPAPGALDASGGDGGTGGNGVGTGTGGDGAQGGAGGRVTLIDLRLGTSTDTVGAAGAAGTAGSGVTGGQGGLGGQLVAVL